MASSNVTATDYLYSSARVRALESKIVGKDKLERMTDARSIGDIDIILGEAGIVDTSKGQITATAREIGLQNVLEGAYELVSAISPDKNVVRFMQYQYDCNNIKAAIKCFLRGIECGEDMLFSYGSIPTAEISEMMKTRDFGKLPDNMAKAAYEAFEAYSKTKDPQKIDMIIDRACYLDMLSAAENSGDAFVKKLVVSKIDMTNLMMCVRVIRMKDPGSKQLLEDSLLDGGLLPHSFLLSFAADGDEDKLYESLASTSYPALSDLLDSDMSLAQIECHCDNYYMNIISESKFIPFGSSVLCAYISAVEYMVKNIRIILAGKEAGLPADTIRERVRESYV